MRCVSVAIDVRGYSPATRGIDVYTSNLLQRWQEDERVRLSLIRARTQHGPTVEVSAPVVGLSFARTLAQRVPGLARPLDQLGRSHDAVFLPNMALYPRGRVPLIVTAHDATALLNPGFFSRGDRLWHWLVGFRSLMRSADVVLANSQQTRSELVQLDVPPERIRIIYLGIEPHYRPLPEPALRAALERYGLSDRPYFLFLGAVERRKNVRALIRGFAHAQRKGLDARLVLAGPVREAEQLEGATEDVRVLGWVDAADKAALYTGATAVVSLARHEGFGFVPLEAFACGTPSLLSKLPVYAETIGRNARYVESDDPEAVSEALAEEQRVPTPVDMRVVSDLRRRFSWDKCAEETLTAILKTAGILEAGGDA